MADAPPQLSKFSFIVSRTVTSNGTPVVFDVQDANPNTGAPIIGFPQKSSGIENQLWELQPAPSGSQGSFLVSQLNGNVVDILNGADSVGATLDSFPMKSSGASNQLWTLDGDGFITSQLDTSMVIEFPEGGDASGGTAVLQINKKGATSNQQWSRVPDYPLEDVLRMKGTGYPPFTAGQRAAYDAINTQLGVADLRAQYLNDNKEISKALLVGLERPSAVQPDDWAAVMAQLAKELQAVADVRLLFFNFILFYTDLTVDQQARLNQAAVDADMDTGTVVTSSWIILVEALIAGFLSLITFEVGLGITIGAIASSAATMISGVTNRVLSEQVISDKDLVFQEALSSLWSSLAQNFEALLVEIPSQRDDILLNWNKLALVEERINASGPTALKWNGRANGELIEKAGVVYTVFALQQLLPTRFEIKTWTQVDSLTPVGFPSDAPSFAVYSEQTDNGLLTVSVMQDDQGLYPGEDALVQDLWDNGVQQSDVFNARNGWQDFQIVQQSYTSATMVLNLVNQTGTQLTVVATPKIDPGNVVRGNATRTLGPYQNFLSIADYDKDQTSNIEVEYQLFDASVSTTDPVISFTAQVLSGDPGGVISAQSVQATQPFFMGSSQLVNGNGLNDTPASMTITIFS